ARRDRFRGVAEMDDVGAAAGFGGIDMARLETEIVDHWPQSARRIASAEIAIDILAGEACVFQRALGDFGMKLRGGFVRRMPGRMFVDAGDVRLAFDGQAKISAGSVSQRMSWPVIRPLASGTRVPSPTLSATPYSAAICLGAGGGSTRSRANS